MIRPQFFSGDPIVSPRRRALLCEPQQSQREVSTIEHGYERHLVARSRNGDKQAFEALYGLFCPGLRKVAVRIAGTSQAEDIVQDTFYHAWRCLHTLRDDGKFGPWLMSIARNRSRDWLRHQRADGIIAQPVDEVLQVLEDYSSSRTFASQLDQTAARMDLAAAFERLPESYRQALYLHYADDLPVAHMSRLLGLPVSTVKWRIHRALELCRLQMLDHKYGGGQPRAGKPPSEEAGTP